MWPAAVISTCAELTWIYLNIKAHSPTAWCGLQDLIFSQSVINQQINNHLSFFLKHCCILQLDVLNTI